MVVTEGLGHHRRRHLEDELSDRCGSAGLGRDTDFLQQIAEGSRVHGLPGPATDRDWADAHLVNAALDIHADDPAFGYRFIADELPEKGITAGENKVQRLCRDHGIWSVFSKKRGLNRKPGPPVHDDLVERDFTGAAPNELWLTDITEHPIACIPVIVATLVC